MAFVPLKYYYPDVSLLPVNDFDWIWLPFVTHTLVAANPIQYIYMSGMLYSVSTCLLIYLSAYLCTFFLVDKFELMSIAHQLPLVFFVHTIYVLITIVEFTRVNHRYI